jgi:hypothetical protein
MAYAKFNRHKFKHLQNEAPPMILKINSKIPCGVPTAFQRQKAGAAAQNFSISGYGCSGSSSLPFTCPDERYLFRRAFS